jgi:hypothetical protein
MVVGYILLNEVKEVSSNVPFLFLVLCVLMLPLIFILFFKRSKRDKVFGKKRSIKEKFISPKVKIDFEGERKLRPRIFKLYVENIGKTEIDLNAPVIIFKRWKSVRKFRIKPANQTDVYPTWMEPGGKYTLNINLENFYQVDTTLRRACRVRIEITDVNGKKFKSRFVRVRWL